MSPLVSQVIQPAPMQMPMEKKVRDSLSKNLLAKKSGIKRNKMKQPVNALQQNARRCQLGVRKRRPRQHRIDRELREPSLTIFSFACAEATSRTNQSPNSK